MGNHRADRRGPIRRPSRTSKSSKYAGRRVAGRDAEPTPIEATIRVVEPLVVSAPSLYDLDTTASIPQVATPGKRKAVRHAGPRGPLFKGLPSPPVLLGVASLAVAVGGALTSTGPDLAGHTPTFHAASALGGETGVGSVNLMERRKQVSRDSRRDALDDASDKALVKEAEQQAEQRDAALGQLAQLAERQADKIAENRWVLPIEPAILTARFGEYGLWSSYHTGLDFNGNTGDAIKSIANGVVTSVGYDGAYGNKTVVTLEDGTEIWYCHQTSYAVSEGDTVRAGEVIGTVGTTGRVTGSHLHLEVRPGGGDPVDPYAAFIVHGVTP
jgi:biotin carboxyl carrier protein